MRLCVHSTKPSKWKPEQITVECGLCWPRHFKSLLEICNVVLTLFYYSWINCTGVKFHLNSLLLIDRRLGNQKAKQVRIVFKVRMKRLWFKADESILQIEVSVSTQPLYYLFWVLPPPSMNFPCNRSNFVGLSFLPPPQSFLWEEK